MELLFVFRCDDYCIFLSHGWEKLALILFTLWEKKGGWGHKGRRVALIVCLIRFELEHNNKGPLKCSYVRVASKRIQGPNFPLCVPDLIPPPTPSLNSPWSPFLLHYHMLHYLLNSPAISLPICSPLLHTLLPLPLSLAVSDLLLSGLCPRISSKYSSLWLHLMWDRTVSPAVGSYWCDHAKSLSIFQGMIAECQGHIHLWCREHGNHCIPPALEAQRTGLPHMPVHHRERVCWPGISTSVRTWPNCRKP